MGQHTRRKGQITRDRRIKLTGMFTSEYYPEELRLVEAIVEVDGKQRPMTFITNNFDWAASSITDLYKCRWAIEVFFKQLKQTLQISDFLGYNENAVRWQIWSALLVYILQRFIAHSHQWPFSFSRLFTVIRGVLWSNLGLEAVLESCGTAHVPIRLQAYLPGFASGWQESRCCLAVKKPERRILDRRLPQPQIRTLNRYIYRPVGRY